MQDRPQFHPPVYTANPIVAGVKAGTYGMLGGLASAGEAVSRVVAPSQNPVADALHSAAQWGAQRAAETGRPDLEAAPWSKGGGGLSGAPSWALYQGAKFLPTLGAIIAGSKLPFVAGAADASGLSELGASVPRILGGGAGAAEKLMTEAAAKGSLSTVGDWATAAGQPWAKSMIAGTAIQAPQSIGALYQNAQEKPGGATQADALRSVALGVPLGVLGAVAPAQSGLLSKGLEGNALARIGTAGAAGAAANATQGAISAAAGMAFRPDLPINERMHNVVDSFLTGGVLGGLMGGAFGIKRDPASITKTEQYKYVDTALSGVDAMTREQPAGLLAPPVMRMPDRTGPPEVPMLPPPSDANRPPIASPVPTDTTQPAAAPMPTSPAQMRQEMREGVPGDPTKPGLYAEAGLLKNGVARDHPVKDFIDNMQATSRPEAYNEIKSEIGKYLSVNSSKTWDEKLPPPLRALGEEFGMLDAKGKPRDLAGDIKDKTFDLDRAETLASKSSGYAKKTEGTRNALSAEVARLTDQKNIQDQAEEIRNNPQPIDTTAKTPSVAPADQVPLAPKAMDQISTHNLARELLGLDSDEALPRSIVKAKVQNEVELRAFSEKSKSPAAKELKEAFATRDAATAEPGAENAVQEPGAGGILPHAPGAEEAGSGVGPGDQGHVAAAEERPFDLADPGEAYNFAKTAVLGDNTSNFGSTESAYTARKYDTGRPGGLRPPDPRFKNWDADAADVAARAKEFHDKTMSTLATRTPVVGETPPPMTPEVVKSHAQKLEALRQEYAQQTEVAKDTPKASYSDSPVVTPISPEAFRGEAQRRTANLSPEAMARVHLLNSANELPRDVAAKAVEDGIKINEAKGIYQNGETYIMRDQHADRADVQETIAHEAIHDALAQVPGYHSVAQAIFDHAGGVDGLLDIADRYGVRKQLEQYIPAGRDLTLADKSDLANEMLAQVGGRAGGKMSLALKAWMSDVKQSFVSLLKAVGLNDYANKVDGKFGVLETAAAIRDLQNRVTPGAIDPTHASTIETMANYRVTPQGLSDEAGRTLRWADMISRIPWRQSVTNFFHATMGWRSEQMMAEAWAPGENALPVMKSFGEGIRKAYNAKQAGDTYGGLWNQLQNRFLSEMRDFTTAKETKAAGEMLNKATGGSLYGYNYKETYDQNKARLGWTDDRFKTDFIDRLKSYNDMRQSGGVAMYDRATALGELQEYGHMSMLMDLAKNSLKYRDVDIKNWPAQTSEDVFKSNKDMHFDVNGMRDLMKGHFQEKLQALRNYVNEAHGDYAVAAKDKFASPELLSTLKAADKHVGTLEAMVSDFGGRVQQIGASPYFPSMRIGDYFTSMHLKQMEDGTIDPQAANRLHDLLQANQLYNIRFDKVGLAHVYARVESEGPNAALRNIATTMQKEGLLNPNETIKSGPVAQADSIRGMGSRWVQELHEAIANGHAFEIPDGLSDDQVRSMKKVQSEVLEQMDGLLSDLIPHDSLYQTQLQRAGTQGSMSNMVDALYKRAGLTSGAMGHLSHAADRHDAMASMNQSALDAKSLDSGVSPLDVTKMSQTMQEFAMRQNDRMWRQPNSFWDMFRAVNHSYFLGFSPAYWMEVISQEPMLAWPEMSKKYGFTASAKALAGATTGAFKIIGAIARDKNPFDVVVTPEGMRKAGIPPEDVNLMMELVNRGSIEMGSFSQAMRHEVGVSLGPKAKNALKYANFTAMYAELFSRIHVALATRDLYNTAPEKAGGMAMEDYAHNVVQQAMLDWRTGNNARQVSKLGFLGPASPITWSFTGYTTKLIEKLINETHRAFLDNTRSPQEQAEARRFLGAHVAAAITLSGTLGLPAAGWIAGAATRASALLSPTGEEFDVEQGYRDFLDNLIGKDAGQIAARGLPRYLGTDTSDLGDAEIAPFTRMMSDRRKWEDTLKDQAMHMMGSPISMASNMVVGGRDFAMGNYLQGLQEMAPRALKSAFKAFRMSQASPDGEYAYHDKEGHKLPLAPDALSTLQTALGFEPGRYAEYEEGSRALQGRREAMQFVAANIRKNLAISMERNDQAGVEKFRGLAAEYDKEHPQEAIMSTFPAYYGRRQQQAAIARTTQLPYGVSPKDIQARKFSETYNWQQ